MAKEKTKQQEAINLLNKLCPPELTWKVFNQFDEDENIYLEISLEYYSKERNKGAYINFIINEEEIEETKFNLIGYKIKNAIVTIKKHLIKEMSGTFTNINKTQNELPSFAEIEKLYKENLLNGSNKS